MCDSFGVCQSLFIFLQHLHRWTYYLHSHLCLQTHTIPGNPEWFGVRKADGSEGFVPAAFLQDVGGGGGEEGRDDTMDDRGEEDGAQDAADDDDDLAKISRFSKVRYAQKFQFASERALCVCVCTCVCARARVCVCAL